MSASQEQPALGEVGATMFRQVNTYEPTTPLNVYRQASMDVIFAQVWSRPGLTRRQRRWVTLTVLGTKGAAVAAGAQTYAALNSGEITLEELGEFLLQLACYAGFPVVADLDVAIEQTLRRIATERGESPPERTYAPLLPQRLGDLLSGARRTKADVLGIEPTAAAEGSPLADLFATSFVYGQVWSRPQLSRGDRRLITIACLAVLGANDLLQEHLRAAQDAGDLDAVALSELALHLGFYAGLPAARRIDTTASMSRL